MTGKNPVVVWLKAARLHTLPLSLSGILMGNAAAYAEQEIDTVILILGILTGILLQVLSNLANDYGDFVHGADTAKRVGPERAVQSGAISAKSMKKAVILFVLLSVISGSFLLSRAVKNTGVSVAVVFLLIGLSAIWAAWHYTASEKPYGYKGWGDVFVFIFFGLAAVWGSCFLQTGRFSILVLLPAAAIGCFSSAVLNLNNMRDLENDRETGKITFAVRLGNKGSRIYHLLLLTGGCTLFVLYCAHIYSSPFRFFFCTPLVFILLNVFFVLTSLKKDRFYIFLKQLSISVLICVLFFWISLFI